MIGSVGRFLNVTGNVYKQQTDIAAIKCVQITLSAIVINKTLQMSTNMPDILRIVDHILVGALILHIARHVVPYEWIEKGVYAVQYFILSNKRPPDKISR